MDSKKTGVRAIALLASLTFVLSACSGGKDSTEPMPTSSVAGPSAWTPEEKQYLDAINGAQLASSIFLSASNYIEIGNTVCNGLKQDMPLEEILSALATSGKA